MQTNPRNDRLVGHLAAKAALHGGQREVFRVWMDHQRDDDVARKLRSACKHHGVRYTPVPKAELDEAASDIPGGHGGVLAEVGPRRYTDPADLIANREPATASPDGGTPAPPHAAAFLAMLDGVEDPFNFGQAVRALYAAGCTGLFVRERNWTKGSHGAAAVVARASAGASERLPMAVVEGPEQAADLADAQGVMIVATGKSEDAVPYTRVDFQGPTLLLIGGERRGLKRSFLAQCANVVTVPYAEGVMFPAALGTVAATAVLAFEVARQRVTDSA